MEYYWNIIGMVSKYNVNINVNKLRNEVHAREDRKIKTFEKVLDMCYQKILNTNKTSDECQCTFICPQVIFGLPLFNLMDCIKFIMEKLVEKGFNVHLAFPNHIYISWKSDQQNNQYDNYNSYMQLGAPPQQLKLGYNHSGNGSNGSNCSNGSSGRGSGSNGGSSGSGGSSGGSSGSGERKLFMNKPNTEKSKQYRPIEDYNNTSNNIYDSDDIDLFRNKIDELFT